MPIYRKAIPVSIDVVYAMGSEQVPLRSGAVIRVMKGQHWPASDPVVKARPELFTTDPRYGLFYSEPPPGHDGQLNELEPRVAPDVEEAASDLADAEDTSAVPGKRRYTRRPRTEVAS